MIVNPINDPVGIDEVIDRLQKRLHGPLLAKWKSLDVYGRAFKKQGEKGARLEVYDKNGEYAPILYSEGNKIFFVQGDRPKKRDWTFENDLWLVCILNIENIKGLDHRAEEEVHKDVIELLDLNTVDSLEYGMANLKRVVEDTFSFGSFKFSDIHPYHVFMVKMKVQYNYSDKC